jgi:hypothetical protein
LGHDNVVEGLVLVPEPGQTNANDHAGEFCLDINKALTAKKLRLDWRYLQNLRCWFKLGRRMNNPMSSKQD